jgi:hypothetical protein
VTQFIVNTLRPTEAERWLSAHLEGLTHAALCSRGGSRDSWHVRHPFGASGLRVSLHEWHDARLVSKHYGSTAGLWCCYLSCRSAVRAASGIRNAATAGHVEMPQCAGSRPREWELRMETCLPVIHTHGTVTRPVLEDRCRFVK